MVGQGRAWRGDGSGSRPVLGVAGLGRSAGCGAAWYVGPGRCGLAWVGRSTRVGQGGQGTDAASRVRGGVPMAGSGWSVRRGRWLGRGRPGWSRGAGMAGLVGAGVGWAGMGCRLWSGRPGRGRHGLGCGMAGLVGKILDRSGWSSGGVRRAGFGVSARCGVAKGGLVGMVWPGKPCRPGGVAAGRGPSAGPGWGWHGWACRGRAGTDRRPGKERRGAALASRVGAGPGWVEVGSRSWG